MAVDLRTTQYRFGADDGGTEATHGWHAAQNANPAQGVIANGVTFLLRFLVQEAGGSAAANTDFRFQCAKNGGAFQDITTTSTIVKAVAATALTDAGNCTQRLTGGTGTFESSGAGQTEDGLSGGNNNDIAASGNSETECGLQIVAANVAPGDTITFRLTSPDFTITNNVVPTLIVKAATTSAVGDTVGLTEAERETVKKPRAETVALTETTVRRLSKALGETPQFTEALVKRVRTAELETVSLGEGFSARKLFLLAVADTLAPTEAFVRAVDKALVETVALGEGFVRRVLGREAETLAPSEVLTTRVTHRVPLPETLTPDETFLRVARIRMPETASLSEALDADAGGGGALGVRGGGGCLVRRGSTRKVIGGTERAMLTPR